MKTEELNHPASASIPLCPPGMEQDPILNAAKSLLTVRAKGSRAEVTFLRRTEQGLTPLLRQQGFIGAGGLTRSKREGDRCTPVGIFLPGIAFGLQDNPGTALPYRRLQPGDGWVDDCASPLYNRFVPAGTPRCWRSAEDMAAETVAYALGFEIRCNPDCLPGLGSAIFLHCTTGTPTAGCVSLPRADVERLLQLVTSETVIVITGRTI